MRYYVDRDKKVATLRKRAILDQPKHKIRDMLAQHKSLSLKDFARRFQIKRSSSMKKEEIITLFVERLLDPALIRAQFIFLSDEEIAFFEQTIAEGELCMTSKAIADCPCRILLIIYAMDLYYCNNRFIFVVPDEIASIYSDLQKTDFPAERAHYCNMNQYATALVSLLGVIEIDHFVEIFNSQNKEKTDCNDIYKVLYDFIERGGRNYTFWQDDKIVNIEFETDITEAMIYEDVDFESDVIEVDYTEYNFGVVEQIYESQMNIPLKDFSREELMKYKDLNYYEITPQHEILLEYIKNHASESEFSASAEYILDEIHELALWGADVYEYSILLWHWDLISDLNKTNALLALCTDVRDNTRKWGLNGWTASELFQNGAQNIPALSGEPMVIDQTILDDMIKNPPNILREGGKVTLNDPCPCGSGKKYKNCCIGSGTSVQVSV
jgi:hypothetical protein